MPEDQESQCQKFQSYGRREMLRPKGSQAGWILFYLGETSLFVLFRPSTVWMRLTHCGGQSVLFSLQIQILISSRNTLTDMTITLCRVTFNPCSYFGNEEESFVPWVPPPWWSSSLLKQIFSYSIMFILRKWPHLSSFIGPMRQLH